MSAVLEMSGVLGPFRNGPPRLNFVYEIPREFTPRGSVLKRSKNARNFENGRQLKYPNLDFDRSRPNTGIRPGALNTPDSTIGRGSFLSKEFTKIWAFLVLFLSDYLCYQIFRFVSALKP